MTLADPQGRPPILFPLFASAETLPGVGPRVAEALAGMGVTRPRDLLLTLPHGVVDRRRRPSIMSVSLPATVTVAITVGRHIRPTRRGAPWRVQVEDAATTFQLVFFHAREDWLARELPTGQRRVVSGKAEMFDGLVQMVHPDHILRPEEAAELPEAEPVYPLSGTLTQKVMARAARGAVARAPDLPEWINPDFLARGAWPSWRAAIAAAHAPSYPADCAPEAPARARLAYDELFAHQLTLALVRRDERRGKGRASAAPGALMARVRAALPYRPTPAQDRAMAEIAADMAAPQRMTRLLQGDVGSGKTLVALSALLTAVEAGGQGVLMAPTEILARQHRDSLAPLAGAAGVRLDLLTGRDRGAERAAKLAAVADGRTGILIGTHAVFQSDVVFADLRLAVVDEQHRFGVRQRMDLGAKGRAADMLVMTATPIPRSLELAQYGDLDVSVLDEKPPGRTPARTALVSAERMDEVVAHLRHAVAEGRQAYWVCPLVEESETVDMAAAEQRFASLRSALGEDRVGLVHGQMSPGDKDAAMADFMAGRSAVLVATTVIEVGVNVPNASIMVIEQAEVFGLAQLHQLRGRVGRGAAASTCLLVYQPPLGDAARKRLETLRETEDGFRIAEVDLALRGAGDVLGTTQSGLPRFRVADLERQAGLMQAARSDARHLLELDPKLETPRGRAARTLLWLMEQDRAIAYMAAG